MINKKESISLALTPELVATIDAYKKGTRARSRSEAVERLITRAFDNINRQDKIQKDTTSQISRLEQLISAQADRLAKVTINNHRTTAESLGIIEEFYSGLLEKNGQNAKETIAKLKNSALKKTFEQSK